MPFLKNQEQWNHGCTQIHTDKKRREIAASGQSALVISILSSVFISVHLWLKSAWVNSESGNAVRRKVRADCSSGNRRRSGYCRDPHGDWPHSERATMRRIGH